MILTFPPNFEFVETDFALPYNTLSTPSRGGGLQRMEIAPPRWMIRLVTTNLTNDRLGALRAWWDSLEGGLHMFYIHDTARPYPVQYADFSGMTIAGGGAFNGTGSVTGYPDAKSIAVAGLPAGFVLQTGDYIGLEEGDKRSLHRITGDVTATAGGTVTVAVAPYVETNVFTTAAVARFEKPEVKAVPDPASWSGNPKRDFGGAGFAGIQVLF